MDPMKRAKRFRPKRFSRIFDEDFLRTDIFGGMKVNLGRCRRVDVFFVLK